MSGNKDPWNGPVTDDGAGDAASNETILVWDTAANAPTSIPLSQYDAAIASGKVRPYEQSVVRTERLGAVVANRPADAPAHLAGGERPVSAVNDYAAGIHQVQRDAFDSAGYKLMTFGEAMVDTLSSGLLHQTGKKADLRRDVNSGSAFAGNLAGLAIALGAGPETAIAKFTPAGRIAAGGERAGKAAAKAIFGEAMAGERTAVATGRRAIGEAIPNAMLGGAAALGHGVTDALIEDKPFAAEHVVQAAGTDLLIGGAFGAGAHVLGKAASKIRAREFISKQGGLLDAASKESVAAHQAVSDAVSGFDGA